MIFPFYDRTDELQWFRMHYDQMRNDCSRMLVLTGRRRVGKTTLVNEAFRDLPTPYLFLYVNSGMTERDNIRAFWRANAKRIGLEGASFDFASFAELLQFLLNRSETTPLTLVVDEFQNCETVAPSFFGSLQALWDERRKTTKMLLILTGSVASAMRAITEDARAPLFGRQHGRLVLQPFRTDVVKTILTEHNPNRRPEDLLTLHMLTGGVPKYIEQLFETGCLDASSMLQHALSTGSFFTTEGDTLLRTEFKSDYAVYFGILERIASGKTKRSEILGAFPERDASPQLRRLEEYYRIIRRVHPFGSLPNGRNFRYELDDDYLLFWFRFIYPNLTLLEAFQTDDLIQQVKAQLPDYEGRFVLERYFRKVLLETGQYTKIAPWWDRKGTNEIDIVAANPIKKELLFAEVKRSAEKYRPALLQQKAYAFLSQAPAYANWTPVFRCLSLEDLGGRT